MSTSGGTTASPEFLPDTGAPRLAATDPGRSDGYRWHAGGPLLAQCPQKVAYGTDQDVQRLRRSRR